MNRGPCSDPDPGLGFDFGCCQDTKNSGPGGPLFDEPDNQVANRTEAGGPVFGLNSGCPILDDFQGWGFRPVSTCALDFLDPLCSV
jgi:hypothetical protein